MLFSILKDQYTWNVSLFVILLFIALAYLYLPRKGRLKRYDHKIQPILFLGALCFLYLLRGSPLNVITHLSFSTHMLQMSIIYFFIPPSLLLGLPPSILQLKYLNKRNLQIVRMITIFALFLFGIALFLYHLPITAIRIMENSDYHEAYLWIMFILSMIMWLPICIRNGNIENRFMDKKNYARLTAMIITPACLLLIILPFDPNNSPLFSHMTALCIPPAYLNHLLPFPFNTKYDQQFAGVIMFLMHKLSISFNFSLEKVFKNTSVKER